MPPKFWNILGACPLKFGDLILQEGSPCAVPMRHYSRNRTKNLRDIQIAHVQMHPDDGQRKRGPRTKLSLNIQSRYTRTMKDLKQIIVVRGSIQHKPKWKPYCQLYSAHTNIQWLLVFSPRDCSHGIWSTNHSAVEIDRFSFGPSITQWRTFQSRRN